MKILFAALLVVLLMGAEPSLANPFMEGKPSEATGLANSLFQTPFLHDILSIQRQIHDAMTDSITALKAGQSPDALLWLLIISFAYGIFHVLAPGHGKVIVTSYFLGHTARWQEGVWAGLIMAVGHTITAVGIVVILYFLLGMTQFHVLAEARYMELIGYGLITAIGLWLILRSFSKNASNCTSCGHHHHAHEHHDHAHVHTAKSGRSLFAATSLVPCTGSMIILLFTIANDVLWAGILAVALIALGMWMTVTVIGLCSMWLRRAILGDEAYLSAAREKLMRGVSVATAAIVTLTGGLLFAGTLYSILA